MSLNDNIQKKQSNWKNDNQKVIKKKLNFNKKHHILNTTNLIESSHYNYSKIFQRKKPPHPLGDIRSSSNINFYPNKKSNKNSLAFYPINLKIPLIMQSNKNIDNKHNHNKSPINIIKIPKTNLNNNNMKINYNMFKTNTNKNKENRNINYVLSASNLSSKDINSGLFKKKIKNKTNDRAFNNLCNSMSLITNHKILAQNTNSNIIDITTNTIKNSKKYESMQKEKEELNRIYNEKMKESEEINGKIKELEKENRSLKGKIGEYHKKNDELASNLDKIIKLIKLLKNNGFDVADILNNLSEYDNENFEENHNLESDKDFSFKMGENNYESISNKRKNKIKNKNNKEIKESIISSSKDNFKEDVDNNLNNKEMEEFSFKINKKKLTHSKGSE